MKKTLILLVSMLFLAGFSSVMAFHDEGVADCGGCHTMHNSQDGLLVDPDSPTGNAYLLIDETPSDTCLSCHAGYGQMSVDGSTRGPGGDFYWLTQTFTWSAHGHDYHSYDREHGHNLDSPGYGLSEDLTLTTAPGGTYDATYLGCNSCHDPHGNENFRLLYGTGETADNYPAGYTFSYDAPNAVGNSRRTNIGDSGEEIHSQHTAYIGGMSDWCANCHEGMHSEMTTDLVHPTNEDIGGGVSGTYNGYVTTGNFTGGAYATAYLPLVPFEDPDNTTTSTTGTDAGSIVMCLTCHRAHASPYRDATRWDTDETLLNEGHPDPLTEPYISYYWDNPLSYDNQRSLCNKCHAQDVDDHLPVPPAP